MKIINMILITLVSINMAQAEVVPQGGEKDSRIKFVEYNLNNVVRIDGFYGFITTIYFEDEEVIVNLAAGDSDAWQITKNNAGTRLYIKPVLDEARTNLTVITNKRDYFFSLEPNIAYDKTEDDNMFFAVRFKYGEDKKLETIDKPKVNKKSIDIKRNNTSFGSKTNIFGRMDESERIGDVSINGTRTIKNNNYNYTYAGSSTNKPITVFDDGKFTYFKFHSVSDQPAIFEIMDDGKEKLITPITDDGFVIVQKIAKMFALRNGNAVTCVFNDGHPLLETTIDNNTRKRISDNVEVGKLRSLPNHEKDRR